MLRPLPAAALAALAIGCAPSASNDAGAGAAAGLSEAHCRAVYEKARGLQGIPPGVFVEETEKEIASCAAEGKLSQEAHDCVMAAGSSDELKACKVDLT